ncbi:MAG: hypothetical protein LR015_14475 [Verrucomicrobia bacterium]|nr:hypothetical protein [Verrucomicrobiota bacterium]
MIPPHSVFKAVALLFILCLTSLEVSSQTRGLWVDADRVEVLRDLIQEPGSHHHVHSRK